MIKCPTTRPAAKPNPTPRRSGWSPERRAKHAAAIRIWAPWAKSTGPKTAGGKARSSQNAWKHGGRAMPKRLLNEGLSAQRHYLRLALRYNRLYTKNPANKLLKLWHARLNTLDRIFHVRLYQFLYYERLCKNLAFSPPLRQKVNANDDTKTK